MGGGRESKEDKYAEAREQKVAGGRWSACSGGAAARISWSVEEGQEK